MLIFGLSSVVSGREGFLALRAKKQVYPLLIREVFVFVCVVPKKLTKWLE